MVEQDVEVSFCDLCGTSVPVADLAAGSAKKHQGKTIGACCLVALRGDAVAAAAAPATVVAARPGAGNGDSRILPVAIVMLAAIAAATIFLDQRITTADARHQQAIDQLADQQKGDSQILASLRVDMDAVPRRQEVAELAAKLDQQAAAEQKALGEQQQRIDAFAGEIAAVAKEQGAQASRTIDYRPLIEDLRQRQQRLLDLVTTLRAVAPAEASTPPVAPANAGNPAAPAEPAAPTLPAALAEHVKKLQAADPAVRFEAVDELLRSKDQQVLPHLLPLARDADSFVRRLTVEGLAAWKKAEVVEALLVALADGDQYVRDTAWRSLKEVTGQKIAFESDGSKDARARAVQKWQDWWEKNKGSFGA